MDWASGPIQAGYRVKYLREAEELRNNPGKWLRLLNAPDANAAWCHVHAIRTGRRAAFRPAGHFSAASEGTSVFVRYDGPPS